MFAPMPKARMAVIAAVNSGFLRSHRIAHRMSRLILVN